MHHASTDHGLSSLLEIRIAIHHELYILRGQLRLQQPHLSTGPWLRGPVGLINNVDRYGYQDEESQS